MKKQTDLLDCWENDFRNGISKYCNGYPAVAKSLLKLIPDIKILLEATATRTRQEVIDEAIKIVDEIPREKVASGGCEGFYTDCINGAIQKLNSLS